MPRTPLQLLPACVMLVVSSVAGGATVDFEDFALGAESSVNNSLGFVSRGAAFNNTFTDFGNGFTVWSGFAPSNKTDVTTSGFANQDSAYHLPGGGGDGSANYAVGFWSDFDRAVATLPAGAHPVSLRVTNTAYTALSMLSGDAFAKKFGGPTGADPDYLSLRITGLNDSDLPVGAVDFFLADFRAAENALDYVVHQWTTVDLRSLSGARKLSFSLDSSDRGAFGINTPTYFAIDNLIYAVPEPSSATLLCLAAVIVHWAVSRQRGRLDSRETFISHAANSGPRGMTTGGLDG